MEKYHVYIRYSIVDNEIVQAIVHFLQEQGLTLFVDYDNSSTGILQDRIYNAINNSMCILLIYSKSIESSQFTRREIEFAIENGVKVIPVFLSDIDEVSWYNSILSDKKLILSGDLEFTQEFKKKLLSIIAETIGDFHTMSSPIDIHGLSNYNDKEKKRKSNSKILDFKNYNKWILCLIAEFLLLVGLVADVTVSSPEFYIDPGMVAAAPRGTMGMLILITIVTILITVIVLCIVFINRFKQSKRRNVKLTCDKSAIVCIDGIKIIEIEAYGVHKIHLSKGSYFVDFEQIIDKSKHDSSIINVKNTSEDIVIKGTFSPILQERNMIKIFVAGSTKLVDERDALRSVINQMYNRYKKDNLIIEAYSFDDFSREFTEGGHQKLYDEFICNEANWVVFITENEMGEKTVWELENAIKAYKTRKHPKILIFSKSNISPRMDTFRKLLIEEKQYWISYNSTNDIKTAFRDHLQWDIYNLIKKQLKQVC